MKLGKDSITKWEQSNIVYKFNCENCPVTYISESKRRIWHQVILRRLGSRMKMIKNFWNFHNPLINIKGKSRTNFKRIDNAVFEKINVEIILLYMGSYGRKLKSINLPSIFLFKMINSLEARLQYEHWIFLNILKQKKCALTM